jgi:hypothetical protein
MSSRNGERIASTRLVWVGPLAAILATIAVVIVRQVAVILLDPDPRFLPLGPLGPPVLTLIGAIGAVAVFAVIGRMARRPVRLFFRLSLAVLLLSLIFPITLLIPGIAALTPTGPTPGTTPGAAGFLVVMHVVAWAAIVLPLTRWGAEQGNAPIPAKASTSTESG